MSNTIDSSSTLIKSMVGEANKSPQQDNADNATATTQQSANTNLADTVSITDAAKKLASVESLSRNDMPLYDSNKLDIIKQQIADGVYEIDSKAIADKLIEFE